MEQAQVESPKSDADIMKGDLPQMQAPIEPVKQHETSGQEPTKEVKQPVYLGSKKFESMEELAQYTAQLEAKKTAWEMTQTTGNPKQDQILKTANKPKVSELMFEDPEAFYNLVLEEAEARVESKIKAKTETEKAVQNFYSKYPDLKGKEDLVAIHANRLASELKDLPEQEQYNRVAQSVRKTLLDWTGSAGQSETLPSGKAITAGTSSGPAPKVQQVSQPKSFAEQLMEMKRKRHSH